jgi:hypothetical protein
MLKEEDMGSGIPTRKVATTFVNCFVRTKSDMDDGMSSFASSMVAVIVDVLGRSSISEEVVQGTISSQPWISSSPKARGFIT